MSFNPEITELNASQQTQKYSKYPALTNANGNLDINKRNLFKKKKKKKNETE